MNYSRRVALWLFRLHIALAKKCVYFSKLEMISFWLLCWKLLRATAGVKRTNGNELRDECSHDQNQTLKERSNHSEAVTMETSQLSEMDPATECKMDSVETVENTEEGGEQISFSIGLLAETETGGAIKISTDHRDVTEIQNETGTINGQESATDLPQQEEALVLQAGQGELIRTDSNTSSVSERPSSPGTIYDNKLACDTQDLHDQKQPDSPDQKEPNSPDQKQPDTLDQKQPNSLDQKQPDSPDQNQPDSPNQKQPDSPDQNQPDSLDQKQPNSPDQKQPDSPDQKQPDSPDQKQPDSLDQKKPDSLDQKQPDSPDQKQPDSPDQKKPDSLDQKQPDSLDQKQPDSSDQKQPDSPDQKQPDSPDQKQPDCLDQKKPDSLDQKQPDSPDQKQPDSSDQKQPDSPDQKQPDSPDQKQPDSLAQKQHDSPDQKQPDSLDQKQPGSSDQTQPNSPTLTDNAGDNHILERAEDSKVKEALMERESQKEIQEFVLEKKIQEEASSEISTVSCQNQDQDDDLSDCLQVEIAIVSSDSETDENWRAIFSCASSMHKEGNDKLLLDGAPETNVGKLLIEKDTDATGFSQGDEAESRCDAAILEQPETPEEPLTRMYACSYDSSAQFHNLSKISEDEELRQGARPNSIHSSCTTKTDTEKRVPSDYCVIQETKSKNVSTEHVDFQLTRKQWLQMEEQTKCQAHQATTKQGTGQSGNSLMYTPVRTINKPKKEPEFEGLGLNEYPYTQFSPCSEDSGLDDSSYRSAYDDPETPIEREIRLELEREESLRRERGFTRAADTGEHMQAKARSPSFHLGKPDKGPSRDRLLRSPSGSKTPPSFTFTSKPSATKAPLYHEMTANNVIILEPADPYPTSPRPAARGPNALPNRKFNEWPSETTSVIILETSNLIIRSASELCLNTASQETQESTFHNNPFFKLRSRSTQSLVTQEIKVVKHREEELKRQRAHLYAKEKYDTVLVSPNLLDNLCINRTAEPPARCKSSPSSPMKTAHKMDRSTLSCDHKYMDSFSGARRKSTMAMRWESGEFANHGKD
ncbi:hypothetical protein SKAU_G00199720 [Synaphobranchus kaupii]|uniref:Uncharacterized protein n=1 Tax=Synaphobranchus kaupii TaxID=118154 RepID=A0A9Q1FFN9_SYNKA|nr:hypothetical protein SKAU_G00199720 [Synaphobranchus kaupii]